MIDDKKPKNIPYPPIGYRSNNQIIASREPINISEFKKIRNLRPKPFNVISPAAATPDKSKDHQIIIQDETFLVVENNSVQSNVTKKPKSKNKGKGSKFNLSKNTVTKIIVTIILVITAFVCVDTWKTNNQIKIGLASEKAAVDTKNNEGKDEADVSREAVDRYTDASNLPRIIVIDKNKENARVFPMNDNTNGSM